MGAILYNPRVFCVPTIGVDINEYKKITKSFSASAPIPGYVIQHFY